MLRLIPYLVFFVFGVIVSNAVNDPDDPEVRYQQHTITKTETETVEVEVERNVVPTSCLAALTRLESLYPKMNAYDKAISPQGEVVNKAMQAIINQDFQELNESVTEQKAINDAVLPAANAFSSEIRTLNGEVERCRTDLD